MVQELKQPFSNLQLELLKLYSMGVDDEDLLEIKDLLGQYFAQKAIKLANQVWDEKGWTKEDSHRLANTRMRTPYNSTNK